MSDVTYFLLIKRCSPCEFVEISRALGNLIILKVVEKCEIYQNKGSQGNQGVGI